MLCSARSIGAALLAADVDCHGPQGLPSCSPFRGKPCGAVAGVAASPSTRCSLVVWMWNCRGLSGTRYTSASPLAAASADRLNRPHWELPAARARAGTGAAGNRARQAATEGARAAEKAGSASRAARHAAGNSAQCIRGGIWGRAAGHTQSALLAASSDIPVSNQQDHAEPPLNKLTNNGQGCVGPHQLVPLDLHSAACTTLSGACRHQGRLPRLRGARRQCWNGMGACVQQLAVTTCISGLLQKPSQPKAG
jgi:hypothetical protein